MSRPRQLAFRPRVMWGLLGAGWIVLAAYPQSTGMIRAGSLVCALGFIALSIFLGWSKRWLRIVLLSLLTIAALLLGLPGRGHNPEALARETAGVWRSYVGSPYVWGGENRLGIDCSGLIRRGLIEAEVRQGLKDANPRLIRAAFSFWWRDQSAKDMGSGRGLTRLVTESPSINETDPMILRTGDIAVTRDGMHVLGYAGDGLWVEADPGPMRVVALTTPVADNHWFRQPVRIMRWRPLEFY